MNYGLGDDAGMIWEGHGGRVQLDLPTEHVPDGTYIRYPLMEELSESVAQEIARTGVIPPGLAYGRVGPGDPIPDFVLLPPRGRMVIHEDSTSVNSPTLLRDLVEPHMGNCTWNACTIPIDPARVTFKPGSK